MRTLSITLLLVFLASLLLIAPMPVQSDNLDYNLQKHSMLGANMGFSGDKPSFRSSAKKAKEIEKVKEAYSKDPLRGGLITEELFGNRSNTSRYKYRYRNYYDTPVFDGKSNSTLCEKCKAKAVIDACKKCDGKAFFELCDKCKAKAILNACESCKAKIQSSREEK
jgi:hypothetical protein